MQAYIIVYWNPYALRFEQWHRPERAGDADAVAFLTGDKAHAEHEAIRLNGLSFPGVYYVCPVTLPNI